MTFNVCVNIDCIMSLIDRRFLDQLKLSISIKKTKSFISIRDIEIAKHLTKDYIQLLMYLFDVVESFLVIAHFTREMHVVDNLKIKLLLRMNIIDFERFVINLNKRQLSVRSCKNLIATLKITIKDNVRVRRTVRVEKRLIIEVNIVVRMSISIKSHESLFDRDYLFDSKFSDAYAHVVDNRLSFVCIENSLSIAIIISRHATLSDLIEFEKQEYYQIDTKNQI